MPTPKFPWTSKLPERWPPYFYDEVDPPPGPISIRKDTSKVTATEVLMQQQEAEHQMRLAQEKMGKQIDAQYLRQLLDTLNAMPPAPAKLNLSDARDRTQMLCMRMRCTPSEFPFKHYTTIYANDKIYVTIVLEGKDAVMFTDDASLFPSDQLIASLSLLRE